MSQKGISFRLNSHVTILAVLIIAVVVYINFHFSNKILIGKIEEGAINQSNFVISKISRITIGTEEIARNVSYQALYYHRHNDLEILLKNVADANPILESVHVELFNSDSVKFTVCNSSTHCQHRCNVSETIFQDGGNLGKAIWSTPFFCSNDSSHLLVTYRMPIFNPESKEVIGAVFCEISLRSMNEMLSKIAIGHKGYSFIIDENGNFLTHPKADWILKKNIFRTQTFSSPERQKQLSEQIKSGKASAYHGICEYFGNKPGWFYLAPLTNTGWMAVIVIPEAELFKEINLIFQKIFLVCSIGIIILFIVNMLIFRRILTPLAKIAEAIQEFATLPGKEFDTNKDEIEILKDSLESWQEKYGSLMKERSKNEIEKIKYEKALKSAREIQQNIVPEGSPSFTEHPEIDLYATLMPAEKIGGDLYDYFFIDKTHLLLAIGDVSGKGIPASLCMAIASTLIKANSRILSSQSIVAEVNKELSNRNSDQYFLTLFIGVLNVETGVLDFCNAAHNYPYILRSDGTIQTLDKSHGLPLGIYRDKSYSNSTIELGLNDTIILYTDGVINATDAKNQYYGTDRLERNLANLSDIPAKELVEKLLASLMIFKGDSQQADDISVLALKYLKNKKSQV